MTTEAQTIIDAARLGAEPAELTPGKIYTVATANGDVKQIDLTDDRYLDEPARLKATVRPDHPDSLLTYWDKHHDGDSEVWANRNTRIIVAVLDAHRAATEEDSRARWQCHRAILELTLSDPLKAWLERDNSLFKQDQFAEFVEDWLPYIVDPVAADLLEMVQSFQATARANFKAGFRVVNGERQLEYTEQIDATVKSGTVPVPTSLTLRMPVWRGASTAEEMTARIRYRLNHGAPGQLGLGFKLDRPTEVLDAAFEAEVLKVENHIGRPVLRGIPAAA